MGVQFLLLNPSLQTRGALAAPRGATKARPLWVQFIFMQFLEKIGQNNRLAPPPLRLAPLHWEILDPPLGCICMHFSTATATTLTRGHTEQGRIQKMLYYGAPAPGGANSLYFIQFRKNSMKKILMSRGRGLPFESATARMMTTLSGCPKHFSHQNATLVVQFYKLLEENVKYGKHRIFSTVIYMIGFCVKKTFIRELQRKVPHVRNPNNSKQER